jgi:hypothetical protein
MAEPSMRAQLPKEEQIKGFELRNIHKLPVEQVLDSNIPEEIVLSILADYPTANAEKVIFSIIHKLKKVAADEAALKKSLQQLMTPSRVRKSDKEVEKQIEAMPITYGYKYRLSLQQGNEERY